MIFEEISLLYSRTEQLYKQGISAHLVAFPELDTFDESRKEFARAVTHHALSGLWEEAMILFNSVHAKIARSPCSPAWLCNEQLGNLEAAAVLTNLASRCGSVDGAVANSFQNAIASIKSLQAITTNPLLVPLSKLEDRRGKCFAVLRDTRIWEEAEKSLEGCLMGFDWAIVKPSSLRNHHSVDRILLFGPPWYLRYNQEQFLVRAPVAGRVDMVVCAHEFAGTISGSLLKDGDIPIHGGEARVASRAHWDFEPMPPAGATRFSFKGHEGFDFSGSDKNITAIPFRLGGKRGTHFKHDGHVWIVEPSSGSGGRVCVGVQRIAVEDLESGDLVIMTTGGGGDLIPLVADMILENSTDIRRLQNEWKIRLRKQVEIHDYGSVVQELKRLGSERATPQNIRNWCNPNPRHIGMDDKEGDLISVLQLVGLSEQYQEVVDGMQKLTSAHISAGSQLHRKLRESLEGTDLTAIYRDGFLEVRDGNEGPAKTIFLVEERGMEEQIPEELEGVIREVVS
jgi:hypothetical protein